MAKIVAVAKMNGKIVKYKLEDGTVIDRLDAIIMCGKGEIDDCMVRTARDGETEYLASIPDGDQDNNLSNLPEF